MGQASISTLTPCSSPLVVSILFRLRARPVCSRFGTRKKPPKEESEDPATTIKMELERRARSLSLFYFLFVPSAVEKAKSRPRAGGLFRAKCTFISFYDRKVGESQDLTGASEGRPLFHFSRWLYSTPQQLGYADSFSFSLT